MSLLRLLPLFAVALVTAACERQAFELIPDASSPPDNADAGSGGGDGNGMADGDGDGSGDGQGDGSDGQGDGQDGDGQGDGAGDCPDEDMDRVCDADDNCPNLANANQKDSNHDGVGDACTSTDACPADGVTGQLDSSRFSVSSVKLDGQSNAALVSAGAQVTIALSYNLQPCTTTTNLTLYQQLLVGFEGQSSPSCAGTEFCGPMSGAGSATLTAPSTPGTYYVVAGVAQSMTQSCGDAWDGAAPGASNRIAVVCVK